MKMFGLVICLFLATTVVHAGSGVIHPSKVQAEAVCLKNIMASNFVKFIPRLGVVTTLLRQNNPCIVLALIKDIE